MGYCIEKPDGSVIELDDETAEKLFAIAKREGTTPDKALRAIIETEAVLVKTLDPFLERFANQFTKPKPEK